MKKDIHPKYYPEAKVFCACGNTWTTGATQPEIRTDVCSNCHPYFTGEQRIVDTAGQVERFTRRVDKGREIAEELAARATEPKAPEIEVILEYEEEEAAADQAPAKAEAAGDDSEKPAKGKAVSAKSGQGKPTTKKRTARKKSEAKSGDAE